MRFPVARLPTLQPSRRPRLPSAPRAPTRRASGVACGGARSREQVLTACLPELDVDLGEEPCGACGAGSRPMAYMGLIGPTPLRFAPGSHLPFVSTRSGSLVFRHAGLGVQRPGPS